jgi:hypothetical protein
MNRTEQNISNPAWLQLVEKQASTLRFGVVVITVHSGAVVQIERTEKIRVEPQGAGRSAGLPAFETLREQPEKVSRTI